MLSDIQRPPFPETKQHPDDTHASIHHAPMIGGLLSLCANAAPGETAPALLNRLAAAARSRGTLPIQGTVFCDPTQADAKKLTATAGIDFPAACLGRHDTPRGSVLGARITALPEGTFERVNDARGANIGARWETAAARYLLLGALVPRDTAAPRDSQAAALWLALKTQVENAGFAMGNLMRTWFYNDHILDWYAQFNRVRNAFFTDNNIFGTLVPASTGIGATNAAGAALTVDALAIAPKNQNPRNPENLEPDDKPARAQPAGPLPPHHPPGPPTLSIAAVTSPLQCPAYDYKSAFSRAVECAETPAAETPAAGLRHLTISGTASIEPGGLTAHTGDIDAQIDLTLRVVAAILESRGMDWRDTARAILYFRKPEWMPRWHARRAALGLPELPAIFAHTDICRDDLLFEIELDATTRLRREIPNPKIPNHKMSNHSLRS